MTYDKLTNEEKINLDNLNYFYSKKIPVHITLLRTDGIKNIFLNGLLTEKFSDTLFIMQERVLGEIRLSLFEIKEKGVEEEKLQ